MAIEIWKPVVGYEGFYEVSSLGRVRNPRGAILRDRLNHLGYNRAALCKCGVRRDCMVHRLVAAAFIGPLPIGKEVNHINGLRADNRVENLEYVTRAENMAHKRVTGTTQGGERNGRAKLTASQVAEIRDRYANGEFGTKLALEYGVTSGTIYFLVSGATWREAA